MLLGQRNIDEQKKRNPQSTTMRELSRTFGYGVEWSGSLLVGFVLVRSSSGVLIYWGATMLGTVRPSDFGFDFIVGFIIFEPRFLLFYN